MTTGRYTDDVHTGVFVNQRDLGNAMSDPRYQWDPNYTRAVQSKVARSTSTDFATRTISGPVRSDPRI